MKTVEVSEAKKLHSYGLDDILLQGLTIAELSNEKLVYLMNGRNLTPVMFIAVQEEYMKRVTTKQ